MPLLKSYILKTLLGSIPFLYIAVADTTSAPSQPVPVTVNDEEHSSRLLQWLRSENGFFHESLEMRRLDPEDPKSFFGMFAKDDISEDDLLIKVPTSIVIDSDTVPEKGEHGFDEDENYIGDQCDTIHNLGRQLKLGDTSIYATYVNYLLDTQSRGSLPSGWSAEGKALLEKILNGEVFRELGYDDTEIIDFPPSYATNWLDGYYHDECEGIQDPMHEFAALLVIQRSWDDLLLPVYDMMSHRNGHWLNTKTDEDASVHDGTPIDVLAKRDIKAGEQIYVSYNMCEDCTSRERTYGTPQIFRDYGFVEDFPQQWIFDDISVGFRLDKRDDVGEVYLTEWVFQDVDAKSPDDEEVDSIELTLLQLQKALDTFMKERDPAVPDYEWDMITSYMNAMEKALIVAVEWDEEEDEGEENDDDDDDEDWDDTFDDYDDDEEEEDDDDDEDYDYDDEEEEEEDEDSSANDGKDEL